jgi:hypothetical protein
LLHHSGSLDVWIDAPRPLFTSWQMEMILE